MTKRLENEKIEDDELNTLVGTLILVVDDLEATLREEIIDPSRTSFIQKGKLNGEKSFLPMDSILMTLSFVREIFKRLY